MENQMVFYFGFDYEYRLVGTGSLDSVFEEIDIEPIS